VRGQRFRGDDPAAYRPKAEVEAKWKEDPIARLADILRASGLPDAEIDADVDAARREMLDAYKTAFDTPFPSSDQAFVDVQDVGDPRVEAY
jgi:TPP-dependent pyruvate/acetoin dehydrogenase alpha subunit